MDYAAQVWEIGGAWPRVTIPLGTLKRGKHTFKLYGAENCCDGQGGPWFFKRESGGWELLTAANLLLLCGSFFFPFFHFFNSVLELIRFFYSCEMKLYETILQAREAVAHFRFQQFWEIGNLSCKFVECATQVLEKRLVVGVKYFTWIPRTMELLVSTQCGREQGSFPGQKFGLIFFSTLCLI
jgi:hypothetical protein